jgi:type VI secretion system protein ImpA
MPLRTDLLDPIPGENPSGENLRYAPVYDQIKEARREELDVLQGDWEREVKRADYAAVIKLASEALAKKTKDLQLAAWLAEALLRREGIASFHQALVFIRALLENFWDTLYPELEDGDPELRAGILEWLGSKLDEPVKRIALTRSGLDWFQYRESRSIPYEHEGESNDAKREARAAALEEGKLPPEEFDKAVDATPAEFYTALNEEFAETLEVVRELESWCDEKFGDVAPSFSGLRKSLEEVHQSVRALLGRKRTLEPQAESPAATEEGPGEATETAVYEQAAPPAPARSAAKGVLTEEPASRDDAIQRVISAAHFIRREEPYSPVPYLMLRGLRWGELRAGGAEIDSGLLEPPPSEIRQQLRRLAAEGSWQEVLETAETAMALPCGRGWLDLQRYVVRACNELGGWFDAIAQSIRSELKALLADYPSLPQMTLLDDTPTANKETLAWIEGFLAPGGQIVEPASTFEPPPFEPLEAGAKAREGEFEAPPDAFALAMDCLRSGNREEAIAILTREISQERSGRGRFLRRAQLAQVCLAAGKELIAYPILRDLCAEIDSRRLEEWEAPDALAHPLVLLYRCMGKLGVAAEDKQRVYERICRLDPVQALSCLT